MKEGNDNQITQWLKKLEQESWQLELLVSAFTIFLLIQANIAYSDFFTSLEYQINFNDGILSVLYLFLSLVGLSIKALTLFLVMHLLLRGFWIGTIGLRSVQSNIDFKSLKYSDFFTNKLQNKVISLDKLVIRLDELCSVIFSFSFLIISAFFSFGLFLIYFVGGLAILSGIQDILPEWTEDFTDILLLTFILVTFFTGLFYFIDFLTLGFFKKFKWVSKIYYPIYKFYGFITLAPISRSIYYYLISKFSKKRIRLIYLLIILVFGFFWFIDFDQYQYYPTDEDDVIVMANYYDNLRPTDDYIERLTIPSNMISDGYMTIYLRYFPDDNQSIKTMCPDFEPLKNDGFNPSFKISFENNNMQINQQEFRDEDIDKILSCLSSLYKVQINDSVYSDLKFYFYEHPTHNQKGIITTVDTRDFVNGENVLKVTKQRFSFRDEKTRQRKFAEVPFYYSKKD